jgi:hypothetical protein
VITIVCDEAVVGFICLGTRLALLGSWRGHTVDTDSEGCPGTDCLINGLYLMEILLT